MILLGPTLAVVLAAAPAPEAAPASASAPPAIAEPQAYLKVPLFDAAFGRTPVARVDEDLLRMAELTGAIAEAHADSPMEAMKAGTPKTGKRDFKVILDRLVNLKLIAAEARDMGLGDDEKLKKDVATFRESALREHMKAEAVKYVKAAPEEVERLYRQGVRELSLLSFAADAEADAKGAVAALKKGKPFAEVLQPLLDAKKARGKLEPEWRHPKTIEEGVAAALEPLKKGEVAGPLAVSGSFMVFQLADERFPESEDLRSMAEETARKAAAAKAQKAFAADLEKRYAKADRKLLKTLDYHSEKRYAAFSKDKRVLARIEGEAPITVADLTAELALDMFHGPQAAIREKRINSRKDQKFENLLFRRLYTKEALARGIDQSEDYLAAVRDHEDQMLFGLFVQRVLLPDLNVMESEGLAYYEANKAEFTTAGVFTYEGLAFAGAKDAQVALEQLRKGADLGWVRSQASNQLPEGKESIRTRGTEVAATDLPAGLAGALTGAKAGDYRLYQAEKGDAYVLAVLDAKPPAPAPYPVVREKIVRRLHNQKVNAAFEDWTRKLRDVHEVEVYVTQLGE